MGRHAKHTRDLSRVTRHGARLVGVALIAGSGVVALAPHGYAGAVNSVTVSVTSSQTSVTSGDLVRYTITATNTGSKPTKPADLVNSVTNGTAQSIRQTGGPDSWTCIQPSTCTISGPNSTGMATGATDTFEVIAQAGSPGTMSDTATVTVYDYSDGPTKSSGTATTTVGSGNSGGGGRTITGFCPSTGCTIRSSASNPTVTNTTVSRVTFPACQFATAASQSLCNHGFTYSYVLAPANFCSANVAASGACTGSTVNLGDLTVSSLPQFDDPNHPINIDLVYEGLGVAKISFNVMKALGTNGIFVFTGIPAPKPAIPVDADQIMRNIVLKNQAIIGTVNADQAAFQNAIRDLGVFMKRWPNSLKALITGRHSIEDYRELLLTEEKHGIKNVISMA